MRCAARWSVGDLERQRRLTLPPLAAEWPSYVAYVAAFAMIGSVWLHHHLAFARLRRADIGVILTNLVLLLTVSVLPFPTAVLSSAWRLGERSDRVVAALLFALVSVAISGAYVGLCSHMARHAELLSDAGASAFLLGERRRGAIAILGTGGGRSPRFRGVDARPRPLRGYAGLLPDDGAAHGRR